MSHAVPDPIGTPGQPWGDLEKARWRTQQNKRRSYANDVLAVIERMRERFDVQQYGELVYPPDRYPLYAVRSRAWDEALPSALITGGVHGYETSGVHGALELIEAHGEDYAGHINLLVAPCVSPWSYETIQRWNPNAVDPNRSFCADSPAGESLALMRLLAPMRFLVHVDLHETTDTDKTEFRPALAARDGELCEPTEIPDGFYLCGDSEAPEPDFHEAIIAAVAQVTHIAAPDHKGELINTKVVAPGVIHYPYRQLGLCAGATQARYRTTTEVYPDSPRATPEQCNAAQVAAVRAAIDFARSQPR